MVVPPSEVEDQRGSRTKQRRPEKDVDEKALLDKQTRQPEDESDRADQFDTHLMVLFFVLERPGRYGLVRRLGNRVSRRARPRPQLSEYQF